MLAWITALASRTRGWLSAQRADQEFENELEIHLEMLTDENIRRGMTPEEARRAARIRLGGHTQLKETNRELQGLPMLETFLQDARYAFRMLRKNPGFTAVAVLTLALGIGANTAIFSVVYAVLLKPLPYGNPDQLYNVFQAKPQEGVGGTGWSYANFTELREQNRVFSEMAGSQQHQLTLERHAGGADLVLGGDFNVAVGLRGPDELVKMSNGERALLERITGELDMIPSWQTANPALHRSLYSARICGGVASARTQTPSEARSTWTSVLSRSLESCLRHFDFPYSRKVSNSGSRSFRTRSSAVGWREEEVIGYKSLAA